MVFSYRFLLTPFFTFCYFLLPLIGTPVHAQFTTVIDIDDPTDVAPASIESNTQLNLSADGDLGSAFSVGASDGSSENVQLNVFGGTAGSVWVNAGGTANVSDGLLSGRLNVQEGGIVNLSGGQIANGFKLEAGSVVNVSGGEIGGKFGSKMEMRGTVNMSGGKISLDGRFFSYLGYHVAGTQLTPEGEGALNLSGGVVDAQLWASGTSIINMTGGSVRRISSRGVVNLSGGIIGRVGNDDGQATIYADVIELNGEPVMGLSTSSPTPLELPEQWLLTGVYPDGTPFVFSSENDELGTPQLIATTVPDVGPTLIDAAIDPVPLGIHAGQTLVVGAGAIVAEQAFIPGVGSRFVVEEGGLIDTAFKAAGADGIIRGGEVRRLETYLGTQLTISGGVIGVNTVPEQGLNIDNLVLNAGSRVQISGGTFLGALLAGEGSEVDLIGSEFFIDGAVVPGLQAGEPLLLTNREGILSGVFADGSPFSFDLTGDLILPGISLGDVFDPNATLRLTLVPEPSTLALCLALAILVCCPRPLSLSCR